MPASLAGQLVVAISSRALFDFEEENEHFEANDDRAYMQLQLERIDSAAKPGVAFSLVQKLLAFNDVNPQAPQHILIIPKAHIPSLNDLTPEDAPLVGGMVMLAREIAEDNDFAEPG